MTAIGVQKFSGPVTSVPAGAFVNNNSFDFISLPQYVTTIGDNAFKDCQNMLVFPMYNNAPDLVSIGDAAFENCTAMTFGLNDSGPVNRLIMRNLTSLGEYAFYGCTNFGTSSTSDPESLLYVGLITEIPDYAFSDCGKLTGIRIYANNNFLTSVGKQAFSGCGSLTQIDIYSSTVQRINLPNVSFIDFGAFKQCSSITSVTLGAVTTIPNDAFYKCTSLQSVTLGSVQSLTSIQERVFFNCGALTKVGAPNITAGHAVLPNVTSVGESAFANSGIADISLPAATSLDASCFSSDYLTTVSIPVATVLPHSCFYGASSLTSVTAPMVQSVSTDAFYECTSLTSISLPNATVLGKRAFSGCTNLTAVEITKVTTIGEYCFQGRHKVTTFTLPKITSIGTGGLGAGTMLEKVGVGEQYATGIDLTNKLFTYDEEHIRAPQITMLMASRTPPAISDNTFATYNATNAMVPYRVTLKTSDICQDYINAWRRYAPFKSATNEVLQAWFTYAHQ